MKLPAHGNCQCGKVTYTLKSEPVLTYACYCYDCQKRTGSAFSLGMIVSAESVEVNGELEAFSRVSDEGSTNTRYSCKECGNIIYGVGEATSEVCKLQPGTLNNTVGIAPDVHIWAKRAPSWFSLTSGAPVFKEQPDDIAEIFSAAAEYKNRDVR